MGAPVISRIDHPGALEIAPYSGHKSSNAEDNRVAPNCRSRALPGECAIVNHERRTALLGMLDSRRHFEPSTLDTSR